VTVLRRQLAEAMPQAPGISRRVRRERTLPFEIVESKLGVPVLRSGTVSRTGLVNRLRARRDFSVATIVAPAGYGKTTLLAQWAARDPRPFAWISIDDRDDDPVVLLRQLAAALHAIRPLDAPVIDALASPGPSLWEAALPRLCAALSAFEEPVVIVVDDAHLLKSRGASEAIAALADHLSDGSVLVLAGRASPMLPIAALRATGRLFEIGIAQLALTPREGRLVLRSTGAELSLAEATELVKHCEGWPAALYLAALGLRESGATKRSGEKTIDMRQSDRPLEDYLRAEYLSHLRPGALRFLQRTSVLHEMCGALCDAVLDDTGSAAELEKVERSNLFLIPLDRHRAWYRYHHRFRELLRQELAEREPELVPILHRRAAAWYEARGNLESALGHARAAGDIDRVAKIVATIGLPEYYNGRVATVEGWFAQFDDRELLERYPVVAVQGSLFYALRGRPADAEEWLTIAEEGHGDSTLRPAIAAVRATMGMDGAERMVAEAEKALAGLAQDSLFRPSASIALGVGRLLLGQNEQAEAALADAADEADRLGATDIRIVALTESSLMATGRSDHSDAEILASEARELAERSQLEAYPTSAMTLAVAARTSLRHGRWDEARALLGKVHGLHERLGRTPLPWLVLQTKIEEARAYLAFRDTGAVESMLQDIRAVIREHPDVGVLVDQVDALERDVEGIPSRTDAAAVGLTSAELRLLPFLATHLSFREIGEALYVSRNTVKTQAISVYRKLGVTSRSEAITCAVDLGLVEDPTQVS
jgi:LuxR family transcriptional regulator, maltose regulon positive regulatory protein